MDKLFWLDMEMTGLEVKHERIIEVAAIVTDLSFNELAQYDAVVVQDQSFIDGMDDWNKKTHGESGLIAKIPNGKDPAVVEMELINLVNAHWSEGEKPVLAGNSIGQDRLFIDEYMKGFSSLLHYRMLDVTSWKIMMANRYKIEYKKQNKHQAVEDIRESINELKHYLSFIKI